MPRPRTEDVRRHFAFCAYPLRGSAVSLAQRFGGVAYWGCWRSRGETKETEGGCVGRYR